MEIWRIPLVLRYRRHPKLFIAEQKQLRERRCVREAEKHRMQSKEECRRDARTDGCETILLSKKQGRKKAGQGEKVGHFPSCRQNKGAKRRTPHCFAVQTSETTHCLAKKGTCGRQDATGKKRHGGEPKQGTTGKTAFPLYT